MRKTFMKKALTCLSAATLLCAACAVPAFAEEAPDIATSTTQNQNTFSGTCGAEGDNVTWTFDPSTATMTFSGTGAMMHYYEPTFNPTDIENWPHPEWYYNEEMSQYPIEHIVFEEGITDIGSLTKDFFQSAAYCTVTVPESVTAFDGLSIMGTSPLEKVTFYGWDGSWFYEYACGPIASGSYSNLEYISLGVAKNPMYPSSGTNVYGLDWSFDYKSRILSFHGTGGIAPVGQSMPERFTIVEKDCEVSAITAENAVNMSAFLKGYHVYCYKDSSFADAYEEFIQYWNQNFEPSRDEDYVRKMYPVNYIEDEYLIGDINRDNIIDLSDVVLLGKYVNGSVKIDTLTADCNGDGGINTHDTVSLLRFLTHKIDTLPENAE